MPGRRVERAVAWAARMTAAGAAVAVLAPLSNLLSGYGLNAGILLRDAALASVGLAGAWLLVRARRPGGALAGAGLVACYTLAEAWLVVVGWIIHPNQVRPGFVLRHVSALSLIVAVVLCANGLAGVRAARR